MIWMPLRLVSRLYLLLERPHLTTPLTAGFEDVFAEEVKHFDSYSAASIAGCKFVNSGKQQVDPKTLKLYVR